MKLTTTGGPQTTLWEHQLCIFVTIYPHKEICNPRHTINGIKHCAVLITTDKLKHGN
jgi:hypothetical protein